MAEDRKLGRENQAPTQLSEADKARIRAEEEYRAQVRAEVANAPKPAPAKKTAADIRAEQQQKAAEAASIREEKLEAERRKQAEERANPNLPKRNPFLMGSEERLIYDQVQRENWTPQQKEAAAKKNRLALGITGVILLVCAALVVPPMLEDRRQQRAAAAAKAERAKTLAGQEPYLIREFCLDSVRGKLKAPASAKFTDASLPVVSGGGWVWTSYVDAQNSFGATVRTSFVCQVIGSTLEDGRVITEVLD